MDNQIRIVSYTGSKIQSLIPEIAKLRIEVFVEYPFLYEGDYEYEKRYLSKFLTLKDAIVVVAFDKEMIIGLSTGYPFIYDSEDLYPNNLKNWHLGNAKAP